MQEPEKQHTQATDGQLGSRALLAATLAYGLLGCVALVAFGTLPAAGETGAELVTWFRDHRESVRLAVWASTVATPPFALMVALLRRLLPAPQRMLHAGASWS